MQRFLEIDTRFKPNYEYEDIDVEPTSEKRSESDVSSLCNEMSKYMKTRLKHVLSNNEGPNELPQDQTIPEIIDDISVINRKIKLEESNFE